MQVAPSGDQIWKLCNQFKCNWNQSWTFLAEIFNLVSRYGVNTLGPLCLWQCLYILSLYSSHKVNAEHTMDHRKWIRKRRTRLGWQPNIRPNWTFCTQILHSSICTQKLGPQMEERARWRRPDRPAGWRRLTSSHLFPPTQQGVVHLKQVEREGYSEACCLLR